MENGKLFRTTLRKVIRDDAKGGKVEKAEVRGLWGGGEGSFWSPRIFAHI